MTRQPKPATGADAHREEQAEEDDEEEEAPMPPVGPGDRDGGGGGGGLPPASSSPGMLSRLPVKEIAIAAGAAIALYLIWKLVQQNEVVNVERQTGQDDEEDEIVQHPDGTTVDQEGNPIIPQDENDPLKADHEAGKWLFGNMGWGED